MTAVSEGWLNELEPSQAVFATEALFEIAKQRVHEIVAALDRGEIPPQEWIPAIKDLMVDAQERVSQQVPKPTPRAAVELMKREQFYKHRLQALSTLQDALGAMHSLSAHHFRRARQGLNASLEYRDEINTVVAEIGIQQPLHVGVPPGLPVIASDLGLCGNYNSRLSQLAVTVVSEDTFCKVYSVGRRARPALAKNSVTPSRLYESPTSLEGLTHLLPGAWARCPG